MRRGSGVSDLANAIRHFYPVDEVLVKPTGPRGSSRLLVRLVVRWFLLPNVGAGARDHQIDMAADRPESGLVHLVSLSRVL